jgi:hypothetical protein
LYWIDRVLTVNFSREFTIRWRKIFVVRPILSPTLAIGVLIFVLVGGVIARPLFGRFNTTREGSRQLFSMGDHRAHVFNRKMLSAVTLRHCLPSSQKVSTIKPDNTFPRFWKSEE